MKQGGLWVCVSKTVCGFLGMKVYFKKKEGLLRSGPVPGACQCSASTWCRRVIVTALTNNQPKPLWVWHPSPLVTDRSREAVCSSFSGSIPRTADVAYTMSAPKRQWKQSRAALAATALWLP